MPAVSTQIDVALVTYRELPLLYEDDHLLLDALRLRGLRVEPAVWDDPSVDWSQVRMAVIRSPWDYHLRYAEFLAWVERVSALTDLWNPAHVLRWNSHKSYLRDLEERGIPIVQTVWLPAGDTRDLLALMQLEGWDECVVKPIVSLNAENTMRVSSENIGAGQAHLDLMLREHEMMVQPYMPSVEEYGERSLVFIAGECSHAVRRVPVLSQREDPYAAPSVAPAYDEVRLAERILQTTGYDTLYARVDMVRDERGEARLMELELVEPSLFFRRKPGAAERMAEAIGARLNK